MKDKRFEDLTPKNTLENKNLRNDSVGQFKGLYFDDHTDSGDIILTEDSAFESTGYAFPELKKWWIMVVIGIVQYSMNLNTSIYSNAVSGITEEFGVSEQAARVGQMIFLVSYAFGTELWAPWSEEFGRWPILQGSLFLVNVWSLMSALSPNFGTVIVARFLGGISSAGGGITLGMISDLWKSNDHQWGLCFVSWTSLGGPVLGAIIGGFIEDYSNTWRWTMWVQLIFGGALQVIHFFLVPETRTSTMLNSEAKRRRKAATKEGRECRIVGPTEKMSGGPSLRNVLVIWSRPFEMFLFEPIVLCCSLLSGFSDMLIFIFLESYGPVYEQWNFTPWKIGLAFMPIMISYCISWASYLPWFYKEKNMRKKGNLVKPEFRLYWLLWTVPLEPIGLFGFAWSSLGPARNVHWIAPMIFSFCVGVANYSIFMATIDFMIQAYGPYSASATGGNAFARNLLAGISAMFSAPFYEHFKEPYTLEYPTTILACIGVAVAIPVYFLYIYGPIIRHKSRFAQTLAHERETLELRHQVRDEKKNIEHRENV